MNCYQKLNARERILSYYFPYPHELNLGIEDAPFQRAKKEWLEHARQAISEVEQMTLEDFKSKKNQKST